MAIDFSSVGATPAHTGKIDFSAIGGVPALGQDEPMDETTALGAAGRGAVSMLPMGNQAYSAIAGAIQKEPFLQERQELNKETQADIANHEPARLAGQGVGLVAPALLTGGASAPESLLGAAGQGAAIGAGFGAGNAIDTLASGGSGAKAAGDVALGAGLGAAGGAVGQKLAGALGSTAETLENVGIKKAAQAMNLSATELGPGMSEPEYAAFQQFVKQQDLLGKNPQEMLNKAEAVQNTFGTKIGEIRNVAGEQGLKLEEPGLVIQPIMDKMQDLEDLVDPEAIKQANIYKAAASTLQAAANKNGGALVFDDLARLKKIYGGLAFDSGMTKNQATADVYFSLKNGLQRIIDDSQDNPNLGQEYKDALKGYSQISPIVDGLQQRVGLARAGSGSGNAATNTALGASMVATGRTAFGTRGLIRGAIEAKPETIARAANAAASGLRSADSTLPTMGAQLGGATAPSAQNMGETKPVHSSTNTSTPTGPTSLNINHPALASRKGIFDKNAANAKDAGELQKSYTMTDFLLSQSDPAWSAAKQKAADNPVSTDQDNSLLDETLNPAKMADGGVVPENGITEPHPELGSTLEGLASQLKNPTHEASPPPQDTLPTRTTQKFNQPFNMDMEDKLRAFLISRKEKSNGGS